MQKTIFCLLFLIMALSLYSCGSEQGGKDTVIATINDYNLLLEEFQIQLSQELEYDDEFKLTPKAKKAFLEEIIRKELLIQEGKRMNIDRKDKFMRAIERYWESTLIRDLMEIKGQEINKKIIVSESEIKNEYEKKYQSSGKNPQLENVKTDILRSLKENKKTDMMRKWIMDLRENADVQINEDILYKN
jgi:hypothetical protein